ncbi:MAG: acyl-CoA thioesterase [Gammaproteobacteria bacterium]|nr:acyl-CoA thioesterase [Gammaproteobacteria bacterium]
MGNTNTESTNVDNKSSDTLPADKHPTIRVVAMPSDTNASGDIFGGWIMSQVDIAGSISAIRRAKGRVATVAVKEFSFKKPVFVGDLISCYAEVEKVGNTSITISVEVFAERGRIKEECVKVTEAVLTYVAVDSNRNPRPVDK